MTESEGKSREIWDIVCRKQQMRVTQTAQTRGGQELGWMEPLGSVPSRCIRRMRTEAPGHAALSPRGICCYKPPSTTFLPTATHSKLLSFFLWFRLSYGVSTWKRFPPASLHVQVLQMTHVRSSECGLNDSRAGMQWSAGRFQSHLQTVARRRTVCTQTGGALLLWQAHTFMFLVRKSIIFESNRMLLFIYFKTLHKYICIIY